MLKARDIMTKDVITISPDKTLDEAIKTLVNNKISGMPVCDGNKRVLGMISERDILNFVFSGNINTTTVGEAMSRETISFSSDANIDKISLVMSEKNIRRVPIIDNGILMGIVSRRSIIRIVLDMPAK